MHRLVLTALLLGACSPDPMANTQEPKQVGAAVGTRTATAEEQAKLEACIPVAGHSEQPCEGQVSAPAGTEQDNKTTAIQSMGRRAACVIRSAEGVELDGPCLFQGTEGGSFDLDPVQGKHLIPNVVSVSLTVTSPGEGHVRGLTSDGINSMWGPVKRSSTDPSCWAGSDFEICVR